MIKLVIDNKEIEAEEGEILLQVSLDNGIYIPNLCYLKGSKHPSVSCRMCFVEIEGNNKPVTSCTVKVKEGMKVQTDTPAVRRLQKRAFQLLMSVHHVNCKECFANRKCELQKIAKFLKLGLRQKEFEQHLKKTEADEEHPFLKYYPNHCVLCGKCIQVCQEKHGKPYLTFSKRGINTIISFYSEREMTEGLPCKDKIACVDICPVGALTIKKS